MSKINHHYVPQFYLRLFASDKYLSRKPKRIHLFNIKNSFLKENVSIKDQCYKRKFYGDTDELENALSVFEGASSWLLTKIIEFERLPPKDSDAYHILLTLIVIQHLRTKHQADLQNEILDGFWKAVLEEDIDRFTEDDWKEIIGEGVKPFTKDELSKYKIGITNPAGFSLALLNSSIIGFLNDLESHLVLLSGHQHLITSDNPVVTYNQYYQWMKEMSNAGLAGIGLQIFLPISPHCLLILYDKNIYHVSGNQKITHGISDKDLQSINLLQYANADQNMFFDSLEQSSHIQSMHVFARRLRQGNKVKTLKFDAVKTSLQNEESVLFTSFIQTPNIRLDLSFMKIKRSAKKVTVRERLNSRYRKDLPDDTSNYDPPPNTPKLFARRREMEKKLS